LQALKFLTRAESSKAAALFFTVLLLLFEELKALFLTFSSILATIKAFFFYRFPTT
jgi:hypothetical protein